jgi:hypothetical protein
LIFRESRELDLVLHLSSDHHGYPVFGILCLILGFHAV